MPRRKKCNLIVNNNEANDADGRNDENRSARGQRKARHTARKLRDSSSDEEFELVNIDEIIHDPPEEAEPEGIPNTCTVYDNNGMKEYKCSKCPKVYTRPSKLRKHFRKHTGETRAKWYNCEQCSKQFSTALKLDKHVIRRHGNETLTENAGSSRETSKVVIKKEPDFFEEGSDVDIKQEMELEDEGILQPKTELFEYSPARPGSSRSSEFYPEDELKSEDLPERDPIPPVETEEGRDGQDVCEDSPKKIIRRARRVRDEEEQLEVRKKRKKRTASKVKEPKEKKKRLSRMELFRLRPHKCPHCVKRYTAKENLEAHMEFHTRRENPFPCDKCEMSFNTFGALRFHIGKVHVDRNCKVCGELMATLTDQLRHKTMHQNKEEYKFECDICHKRFARGPSVTLHKEKIHSGGPLKCLNCPESFTKPVYLLGHALEKHGDDKPFGCTLCSYRSNRQYHVDIHFRSHSLDMQLHCDVCGRFFTNMSNFNTHKKEHENNPADVDYRTCKVCGKVFARRTYLNKHMKIHSGDLPFQCADCEKRFTTKGQLVAHMIIHSNVRPYQCEICAKTFPRSGTLKIHRRFHTNERPYQCRVCSKAFHSATLRKTHEKTHTGDTRKYTCTFCGRVYVSHKCFKAHLQMHQTNEVSYNCPTCGICFMKMSRLNKHILTHVKGLVPDHQEPQLNVQSIQVMSLFCDVEDSSQIKSATGSETEEVCRICVEKCTVFQSIFRENDQEYLSQYFGILVQETDSWPKSICSLCHDQMKVAMQFIIKVHNSEKLLCGLFGRLRQIPVKPDIEIVEVKEDQEKCENEDDEHNLGSESSTSFDDHQEETLSNDEDSHSDPLGTSAKDVLETSEQNKLRNDKEKRDVQLSRIEEFFKMDCEICDKKCAKLRDLQIHFRQEHKQKAFVVCCKSKFRHRCKIQEHMELHLNPDAFKCVECGKMSRTKYNLHLHMKNSHTPKEFHKFMCDKCPATFMTMERYKKHAFVHLPEDKKANKCPKCSKAFAFKANLRIHVEQVHNKGPSEHICEVCAKIFSNAEVFRRHSKTHCKERLRKFSCNTCDKTFVYEYHLKRHILRHNDSGETFVCHICGKSAPNGPALNAHINYVHIKERNHKCNQCDSAFKTPRALRQHVICHHTGEVLYTCVFCYKRFKCRTSKYFHQKHQHPAEYKEMQEKKKAQ
ncbi:zinc finger protein 585B-like [Phlebotomus argentipes]|uniref:zinc finger protein 585B-like n=1 Tax=Phlebotomus argentipes TaxID=94469 RepID=UPI002892AD92|nr:zinc finger protein 585B-like [Phlebotomus argentipes]